MVKVFKFGGASINDAESVRNMAGILRNFRGQPLVIVVSAMGKTTNALEGILIRCRLNPQTMFDEIDQLKSFHHKIMLDLFPDHNHPVYHDVNSLFDGLIKQIQSDSDLSADGLYDQMVVYGELISSFIVCHFLNETGLNAKWIDARDYVITDDQFRSANVLWDVTKTKIEQLRNHLSADGWLLTQGFIGSTAKGRSTTLGREGSDYSAAIFAWCLDATEVVIWKDVPGLLNADPKRFSDVVKLDQISYAEAIELAYYGATIIHPKTIKPLQNKGITLKVQSFKEPGLLPSIISDEAVFDPLVPSIIVKGQQVLISISPRDFSFMNESNLHQLFGVFDRLRIPVHVLQTSALSLSICTDYSDSQLLTLIDSVSSDFYLKYNTGLDLLTVRHYNQTLIDKLIDNREVLLEQRSRVTAQLVIRR